MKKMLKDMRTKLQQEKGEVSVEWALVAIVMAIAIIAAFLPSVQAMLTSAISTISDKIAGAGS